MAFIEIHHHYHGFGQKQVQAIHSKIDILMANAAELLAKVEVIKTNVGSLDANIKNIDADVKNLLDQIDEGLGLDAVAEELEKLSVKTSELATASKVIADSVEDAPVEPPVETEE